MDLTPGQADDRLPPHSVEAEEAVLGSVLIDPGSLPLVAGLVRAEDFFRQEHRDIFAAMLALQGRGSQVDTLTVFEEMGGDGHAPVLLGLASAVPTSLHAEHYAAIVAAHAARRRLIDAGSQIVRLAWDGRRPLDEAESGAMDLLVAARAGGPRAARAMPEAVRDYYAALERLAKGDRPEGQVPTGFRDLDSILGGLCPSDLVLLAARPSMGKTSMALGIARNAAALGLAVAFFSLEMSEGQLVQRLLSLDSAVPASSLRDGKVADAEWPALTRAMDGLSRARILLDDSPGATPAHVRAGALRARAMAGLDLVVVDYVQLMRTGHRAKGRYEEVTEISQALKALAKDLGVPVLALSQLNRECESRSDKRPQLSDLRESGSLEQDADVVLFIYRGEVYGEEGDGLAEVRVAKHRNGPTGTATLRFRADLMRFEEVTVTRTSIDEIMRLRERGGDWL